MQKETAQNTSKGISDGIQQRAADFIKRNPKSQNARVLTAIMRPNGVTSYELSSSGILGYNTRIRELRMAGFPIITTMEKHTNQNGETVQRGRFTLALDTEQAA